MVFRHTYKVKGARGRDFGARKVEKVRGRDGDLKLDATTDRPLEFAYLGKLEKGEKNLRLDRWID